MVKYLKEAFDSEYTAQILGDRRNKNLRELLTNKGIDIKQLKLGTYPGDVSNRSPLWKQTADQAIANGQMLGFLFPSGYLYIAGCPNDNYIDKKDRRQSDSWNLDYYSQLSRQEVARRAEPIIISNIFAKKKRDKYDDPRYDLHGNYMGQRLNPYYDPDSEWEYRKSRYTDNTRGRMPRDKSGYALQSLANLKAKLFKKYSTGDVDEQLFKRFRIVGDKLKTLYKKLSTVDMSQYIFDYDKGYKNYSDRYYADRDKTNGIMEVYRDADYSLQEYRNAMGEANSDLKYDNDISGTVNKLDRLGRDIDSALSKLSKLIDQ